jgi:hypothetical protein
MPLKEFTGRATATPLRRGGDETVDVGVLAIQLDQFGAEARIPSEQLAKVPRRSPVSAPRRRLVTRTTAR